MGLNLVELKFMKKWQPYHPLFNWTLSKKNHWMENFAESVLWHAVHARLIWNNKIKQLTHFYNHDQFSHLLSTYHQPAAGRDCSAHSLGFYRLSLAGSSMWGLAYLHCWKSRSIHWALGRLRGQNQHGQRSGQGSSDHPHAVWLVMRPEMMWTITDLTWRTRKMHSLYIKTSLTLHK